MDDPFKDVEVELCKAPGSHYISISRYHENWTRLNITVLDFQWYSRLWQINATKIGVTSHSLLCKWNKMIFWKGSSIPSYFLNFVLSHPSHPMKDSLPNTWDLRLASFSRWRNWDGYGIKFMWWKKTGFWQTPSVHAHVLSVVSQIWPLSLCFRCLQL